jgi:hypothetical protein
MPSGAPATKTKSETPFQERIAQALAERGHSTKAVIKPRSAGLAPSSSVIQADQKVPRVKEAVRKVAKNRPVTTETVSSDLALYDYRQLGITLGAEIAALWDAGEIEPGKMNSINESYNAGNSIFADNQVIVYCSSQQFWCDVSAYWQGQWFYYKFVTGEGEQPESISGMDTISYLLGGPMKTNTPEAQTEQDLQKQIRSLSYKANLSELREYFLICSGENSDTILPLTALRDQDFTITQDESLELAWKTVVAEHLKRTPTESAQLMARKMQEYAASKAALHQSIKHLQF